MHENAKPTETLKHLSARTEAQFKSPHFTVSFPPRRLNPYFAETTHPIDCISGKQNAVLEAASPCYPTPNFCDFTPNFWDLTPRPAA
jgi:hypothetical protein